MITGEGGMAGFDFVLIDHIVGVNEQYQVNESEELLGVGNQKGGGIRFPTYDSLLGGVRINW